MKKIISILFVLSIISFCFANELDSKEIKSKISFINLINGLYLTENQFDLLIILSTKAEKTRNTYKTLLNDIEIEGVKALEPLEKEVLEDRGISKEVKEDVNKYKQKLDEVQTNYDNEMKDIINKTAEVFNENQRYLICKFKPCLIPPEDPNSVKVGQVESGFNSEKIIENIRNIKPKVYLRKRNELIDKFVNRAVEKKIIGKDLINSERIRIGSLMDEIRKLSEVEYKAQKENFAFNFMPKKEIKLTDEFFLKRIENFFLSDFSKDILTKKKSMK